MCFGKPFSPNGNDPCGIAEELFRRRIASGILRLIMSRRFRPAVSSELLRLRPKIVAITRAYGVRNVRIFGSFARGEQRPTSDIDLLVDLPDGMTLFELSGLKIDLEETLKRSVDIVSARSIKPALREAILADARAL